MSILLLALMTGFAFSQTATPSTAVFEESVPPGNNYDKAEFRLWYPPTVDAVRAVVVLVPGSNGDGRAQAEDVGWQAFATKNKLALVGVRITDKPHEQSFIEHYVDVSHGSGQALLIAMAAFAEKSKHSELARAPFLLWGMSAGGEFNYEFVNWKPERVVAFVVNKGGIYYSALASREARNVPGILFIGGKDLDSRVQMISGLFQLNRRGAALWALAEEPAVGHVVGRSIDIAKILFEDALAARIGDPYSLKPVNEKDGFIGDLKAKTYQPAATAGNQTLSNPWFLTERIAKAWKAMVTETPFDPQQ